MEPPCSINGAVNRWRVRLQKRDRSAGKGRCRALYAQIDGVMRVPIARLRRAAPSLMVF